MITNIFYLFTIIYFIHTVYLNFLEKEKPELIFTNPYDAFNYLLEYIKTIEFLITTIIVIWLSAGLFSEQKLFFRIIVTTNIIGGICNIMLFPKQKKQTEAAEFIISTICCLGIITNHFKLI